MGFFGERGVDVLDLTLLQKKGILKIKEAPREADVIDLTKMDRDGFAPLANKPVAPSLVNDAVSAISSNSSSGSAASAPAATFASFWDAPVSTSPSNFSSVSSDTGSSSVSESSAQGIDARNLSVKVEDVEYKMERLSERLIALEARVDELISNIR